jgi:hypothetical protein
VYAIVLFKSKNEFSYYIYRNFGLFYNKSLLLFVSMEKNQTDEIHSNCTVNRENSHIIYKKNRESSNNDLFLNDQWQIVCLKFREKY